MRSDCELQEAVAELLANDCATDDKEVERTLAVLSRFSAEEVGRINDLIEGIGRNSRGNP